MGNSLNSVRKHKYEKPKRTHFADKWRHQNVARSVLNNFGGHIIGIDMMLLDQHREREILIAVLTPKKVVISKYILKSKKYKLDYKSILDIPVTDGRRVILHPNTRHIVAVECGLSLIRIFKMDIASKSYQAIDVFDVRSTMTLNGHYGLNITPSTPLTAIEWMDNDLYFNGEDTFTLITANNAHFFVYDFIRKRVLHSIDLSLCIYIEPDPPSDSKTLQCIDYVVDGDTNCHFAIFAKRVHAPNDREMSRDMVYLLNITKMLKMTKRKKINGFKPCTSTNQTNRSLDSQWIWTLDSESNTFEALRSIDEHHHHGVGLKLVKQIQCVAFAPNMSFLAISCGSSIDFFRFQNGGFVYVNFVNYGGFIENMVWIGRDTLMIISKSMSSSLLLSQIKRHEPDDAVTDSFREWDLTEDIIFAIFMYLEEWEIKHGQIDTKCGDITRNPSLLKSCIDAKTVVVPGQVYPELLVATAVQ